MRGIHAGKGIVLDLIQPKASIQPATARPISSGESSWTK
jgi:hypothetical protein